MVNVAIIAVVAGVHYYLYGVWHTKEVKPDLDSPSPALGKAVATVIHQAVTDPYFRPLEKLHWFLSQNPGVDQIAIELLTKWSPDDEFPVCFVWTRDMQLGAWKIDHPASPWVIETVQRMVAEGLRTPNPQGRLNIGSIEMDGEKYWLGYMRVPLDSPNPNQIAGVFFSIDDYLKRDVPRLINDVTQRARFPLVQFQQDHEPIHNEKDGFISFRILNEDKETYYEQGRTFEPYQRIYAESQYYPKPIVCMQEGWDLEVFSANIPPPAPEHETKRNPLIWIILECLSVSGLFWFSLLFKSTTPRPSSPGAGLPNRK